jgi:hypothetical protein
MGKGARTDSADRLVIDLKWGAAVGRALGRKRPTGGWPKPERKPRRRRAKSKRKRT